MIIIAPLKLRFYNRFMRFHLILLTAFLSLLLISPGSLFAQNMLDDIEEEDRVETTRGENAPNLVAETIKTIAPSKKIFIITNENRSFSKGDFISLLLNNKLVCRALVAKTNDQQLSGIKIVKIYNLALWKQLGPNKEVLVLKGDDSYYTTKESTPAEEEEKLKNESKVQDEEDLYNSTTLEEDDLSLEESNNRKIKTDNLLSLGVGMIEAKDIDGSSKRYTHFNGAWGYQLAENIWGELGLGTNTITDYPGTGIDTRLVNIMTKVKYTFDAPLYSYIMPYVGYQVIQVDSPGAGEAVEGQTYEPGELDREKELVEDLKKSSVIFGVTVLKRIVPGWFIRADLGTDIISGGLTLEF